MDITRKRNIMKVQIVEHNKKVLYWILALVVLLVMVLGTIRYLENKEQLIGGDKDVHGCLIAAGYSWNETKQDCVREWEEQNKVYCTNEQRNGEVCPSLWQPVCGNAYEIGDKKPVTLSNSCIACLNKDIIYWIEGECVE